MAGKNRIAAGDKATVESARIVLDAGGNAFDATVAACFTAMLAEPVLTSAGGGGFLNAYPADGKPILFDFFVNTPSGSVDNIDFIETIVDFGTTKQTFHTGRGSVAVPGAVAGLFHVQQRLGNIPIRIVMEPVIDLAKNGIHLSSEQVDLLRLLQPIMTYDEIGREMFINDGVLISGNDKFRNTKFADFLDVLIHEGTELFYKGEVAKNILAKLGDGGLICRDDLSKYEVVERKPLKTPFHDYLIFGNPPPALSGILMDVTLTLLESSASKKFIPISLLVKALEITDIVRGERLKELPTERTEKLTQSEFFKDYLEMLSSSKLGETGTKPDPHSCGSTTHISILDRQGNAVSVTTTNGAGSGIFIPETGIMLNSMLGEQDLNPNGFHQYTKGIRLSSMISPIIVTDRGKPVLVTGSAGSNRIRSAVIQVVCNMLCNKMGVEDATIAPRVHLEGNTLHMEPGILEDDLAKIKGRYKVERWDQLNLYFGGANTVSLRGSEGDPRRGGFAMEF